MTFTPTRAIVTASDSGIGKATAVALAAAGMDVGITWHTDEQGAQQTADEVRSYGRNAVVARLDTSDIPACGDVIDGLIGDLGGLDVFVNNAGTGDNAPFLDLTLEQWRHTVSVDLEGAFVCLQRAARHMVDAGQEGRLIAITSVHEHQPRVGSAAYDAAKHGLGGLMKTLALELGRNGITANSVAPGEIATPMTARKTSIPTVSTAPACRWDGRATRGRSRPWWPSSHHQGRRMSPGHRGSSTAACCRWARRAVRTSRATTGGGGK